MNQILFPFLKKKKMCHKKKVKKLQMLNSKLKKKKIPIYQMKLITFYIIQYDSLLFKLNFISNIYSSYIVFEVRICFKTRLTDIYNY